MKSERNRPALGAPPPAAPFRDQAGAIVRLLPLLWPRGEAALRLRVVAAVALIVTAKLINIGVPLLYKRAIDALSGPAVMIVPVALIVAYGLARVGAQAAGELRELVFARVAQRAIRLTALAVFRHLHALSLRFHLERQTGGLSRAVERGTTGIEYLLGFTLFNILPTLLEIALVSVVLWRFYSVGFALITLATIICYVGFTISVTQWRVRFRREMNERDGEASTKAIDSLLNYETVKYFANEAHEAERFDRAKRAYETAAIRSQTTLSMLNLGQGAIIAAGLITVMVMAGQGVADGSMTLGDFVLVNAYLLQLYAPLNILGMVYRNVKQSLADVEAMYRLLAEPAEIEDRPGAAALVVPRGRIRFEHVSFAYDPRRQILDDISFEVPPGRTVALVGPSGGGKSTIARLLFRFYDVGTGAITIDGQDLRDVTQLSLRQAIGVVPQDTVLFNDTIYYNIAYGRPDAPREAVEHAARLARIHDFVAALPDGYQSRVGERGLKLSGGEKQRVAIARVILKRPSVLIFDEATSALDSHTEQEIQTSLRAVSAERSTLVIAHRLSTIVDADEILVLEGGRIVERGRHAALLAADGAYAAMWQRQRRAAERDAQLAEVAE
ncbi:MAG: ATP-binding cassette, subfamily heavy metal transporter [Aliidongia sp.]|nr:ATP-binding cassette, subfamily heavy metal transporter [Aliidongia sp.]